MGCGASSDGHLDSTRHGRSQLDRKDGMQHVSIATGTTSLTLSSSSSLSKDILQFVLKDSKLLKTNLCIYENTLHKKKI